MVCGGQVGHPGIVQVTVVHGIFGYMVCVGVQVGHPGIFPVCPGNCGTQDVQINSQLPGLSRDVQVASTNSLSFYCNEFIFCHISMCKCSVT